MAEISPSHRSGRARRRIGNRVGRVGHFCCGGRVSLGHDLITAEETEAWLANRGLTFDDFSDYFARQYCVGAINEGFSPKQIEYAFAAQELREPFVAELILSGTLEEMTIKLCGVWPRGALEQTHPEELPSKSGNFSIGLALNQHNWPIG